MQMWDEVSRAISWTMDNIRTYGGDARRVSLVGHSAGAQLCARALLQRAGVKNVPSKTNAREFHADSRMPRRFVGIAGVYDIGLSLRLRRLSRSRHREHDGARHEWGRKL